MDSLTLALVILIFLCCLGLHFATAVPLQPTPIDPFDPPARKIVHVPPLLAIRPAVLRQNVAVARLMRVEGLT